MSASSDIPLWIAKPAWAEKVWNLHCWLIEERNGLHWEAGSAEDRHFVALSLAGEVGELCNLIKKDWRGDPQPPGINRSREQMLEFADIRMLLEVLARICGLDLDSCVEAKLEELKKRWAKAPL